MDSTRSSGVLTTTQPAGKVNGYSLKTKAAAARWRQPILTWGDSMWRLLIVVVSGSMLVACGCGGLYTKRMDRTFEDMKYNHTLDQELMPASSEGKLKEMNIYVRAPKKMELGKEFTYAGVVEPGKYDVERTFFEGSKSFLHVLARQKTANTKKAKAAPAESTATRGAFNPDVLAFLKSVYGEVDDIALEKLKDDGHKKNTFKRLQFNATVNNVEKKVQVYLIKEDKDEVALIFEFLPADKEMNAKIKYCLESFALGNKARNKYSGATSEVEAEAEPSAIKF
jgi:hypothetical protein